MAIRSLTASIVIAAAVMTAWRLSGLVLATITSAGAATIVASGVFPILAHLWPALIAAAGLSALVVFGMVTHKGKQGDAPDQIDKLQDLHDGIQSVNTERERLMQARAIIQEKERNFESRRRADAERFQGLNADRSALEQTITRQQQMIERLKGELVGARDHIRRMRHRL